MGPISENFANFVYLWVVPFAKSVYLWVLFRVTLYIFGFIGSEPLGCAPRQFPIQAPPRHLVCQLEENWIILSMIPAIFSSEHDQINWFHIAGFAYFARCTVLTSCKLPTYRRFWYATCTLPERHNAVFRRNVSSFSRVVHACDHFHAHWRCWFSLEVIDTWCTWMNSRQREIHCTSIWRLIVCIKFPLENFSPGLPALKWIIYARSFAPIHMLQTGLATTRERWSQFTCLLNGRSTATDQEHIIAVPWYPQQQHAAILKSYPWLSCHKLTIYTGVTATNIADRTGLRASLPAVHKFVFSRAKSNQPCALFLTTRFFSQ